MLLLIMKEKHYCYIPFEGLTVDPKGRAQLCPVWTANEEHVLHDLAESHKNIEEDLRNLVKTYKKSGDSIRLRKKIFSIEKYFPKKIEIPKILIDQISTIFFSIDL